MREVSSRTQNSVHKVRRTMRMTRLKIEALLARIKDDFEVPLTQQLRDYHFRESRRNDIPMKEIWEHEEKLRMDECYCAIDKLLRYVPEDATL